jgi:hypothetical protein
LSAYTTAAHDALPQAHPMLNVGARQRWAAMSFPAFLDEKRGVCSF